ncbi:amiloride-sensitive amine oxidase [copper-containing] [Phodopus roborovskii]|uniref:Amine oxidase n=1 Tax=Phodopus roborovskii TaxID=109678 RepID=A0AAV0A270_PHORO|nr:amiloride-sensitive amine oxidase [copper-containing] [Phodopus roborovskii]XP_051058982.1 amiloride-sensitive amine oxidase [copper-containing] [Phodopus roborovskii]CAH7158687.1 Doxl1 [Phodopus roborovskii]
MGIAQRTLTLGWVAAILLLQMAMAEHPMWNLNGKTQVFLDLTPFEMKAVHSFLMNRKELQLQPSKTPTLAKNSLYLMEMLLPNKKDVLNFLDKGKRSPVREARVVIFFGAQEYPNVTEFAIGPLPLPIYMREILPRPDQHPSWASRPISKAEYSLILSTLKKATEPLNQFFLDTTDYSLKDCVESCLTFTYVAPHGTKPGQRRSWFILQRYMADHFLQPTGLEILLDHGNIDVQLWKVEQVWYNGKLYDSPQELAQKYEGGEVDTVVLMESLPRNPEQPPLFSFSSTPEEFPTTISMASPRVAESHLPPYNIEGNTVYYRDWIFSFRLRPSSGLQILNVHFRGMRIAYEVSVQEAVAQFGGHITAGIRTKYMDVGWAPNNVIHRLVHGIDCPDAATFLEVIHHYDTDIPVSYPQALCLFEMPAGIPIKRHFNSNFKVDFNSSAEMKGYMLVLRTTSTVHHYNYIWDFIFYPNGAMETKMQATGLVHATFFQPKEMSYISQSHTHLFSNLHTHLVHYRIDLDVAGSRNSFQTLKPIQGNITKDLRHHVMRNTLKQTNYSQEHQAAFHFGKPLPTYLVFSNLHRAHFDHRNSYRLQIYSKIQQLELPGWQKYRGLSWARYPLAVTKYRDSERCSSSIYSQNNPWNPPIVFKSFIQNNTNIEDKDLVAWVTVGFHNMPHFEDSANMTTLGNSAGFVLRPFSFFRGF